MQKLCVAASNLWSWLETWIDDEGGVHGYIVYHHRDNLKILSPDTWAQATSILGLLGLYRATGEERWLSNARRLSMYLVRNYIGSAHVFRNSNFDRKPLGQPALEGNALPSYALLETSRLLEDVEDCKLLRETAKDNVFNFILRNWDESIGAFTSVYHGAPAHIHNKNSLTIMTIISLAELEGSNKLLTEYASRVGDFILRHQVKKGSFAGAYPYADSDANFRTTYTLITCMGLLALFERTNENRFLESVKSALNHLSKFVDEETGLICHLHKVGYPQWILDTFLLLMVSNKLLKQGCQIPIDIEHLLDKLLSRQYPTGAFGLSVGFEDLWFRKRLPSRPEINRWRDALPIPSLNSWILWAISELLPRSVSISSCTNCFPFTILTDAEESEGPYKITENEDEVIFEKIPDNKVVGVFRKRAELADLCLIKERGDYWKTIDSIMRYPKPLRKLILAIPYKFF